MNSEIERLAKEAGLTLRNGVFTSYYVDGVVEDDLSKFAALVAESCAKECDGVYYQNIGPAHGEVRYGIAACAAAIRAKFALSHKAPEAK